MEMASIVNAVSTAVQDIAAGQGGAPVPQYVPTTPQGKRGYDQLINALNRLPRPLMALGSLAIFVVAGFDPAWFETQMQTLAAMPQPMWWLLGAVITMFFGGREAFYIRQNASGKPAAPKA